MRREFEAYLKCGRLEHGLLRVQCERCGDTTLRFVTVEFKR